MKEVTDSDRIFKKVKQLAKYALDCETQIKKIDRETRDQIEALEDLKDIYLKRMNNLKDIYHEKTRPGFKSQKNILKRECNPKKV